MSANKMHADEADIDVSLVRRLIADQFPQWADLPIHHVSSAGTDNAIYRVGDDLAVRLPRVERAMSQVDKEQQWLPKLAPDLPLAVPVPIATGMPGEGYPWRWAVVPWLRGDSVTLDTIADPAEAAADLASFLLALQAIDAIGGPRPGEHNFGRGVPLIERDRRTREAIEALQGLLDTDAATDAWDAALDAPEWDCPPVWIHGDLSPGNLLAVNGKLSAVIDFGGLAVADPACDVMIAWTLFAGRSREVFREALRVDDATWARGRGWALSWALIFIPYYLHTNPAGVAKARRTLDEVLSETAKA